MRAGRASILTLSGNVEIRATMTQVWMAPSLLTILTVVVVVVVVRTGTADVILTRD